MWTSQPWDGHISSLGTLSSSAQVIAAARGAGNYRGPALQAAKPRPKSRCTLTSQGRSRGASETVGGMRGRLKPSHCGETLSAVLLAVSHTTLKGVVSAAGAVGDIRGVVAIQLERRDHSACPDRAEPAHAPGFSSVSLCCHLWDPRALLSPVRDEAGQSLSTVHNWREELS